MELGFGCFLFCFVLFSFFLFLFLLFYRDTLLTSLPGTYFILSCSTVGTLHDYFSHDVSSLRAGKIYPSLIFFYSLHQLFVELMI